MLATAAVSEASPFIFVTCQVGAEPAVKDEVVRAWPDARFAFSRPGFLTFKVPPDLVKNDTPPLRSVFARTLGWSLGPARGATPEARAEAALTVASDWVKRHPPDRVHVWQRDFAIPGYRGYEPGMTAEAVAARDLLVRMWPAHTVLGESHDAAQQASATSRGTEVTAAVPEVSALPLLAPTRRGQRVLDFILVDPELWWVGHHRVWTRLQAWPGGLWPGDPPTEIVSRAYLKMAEALDWSRLPIKPGQRAIEIGCAPGGASQALLDRGLRVIGVDPAEVDRRVTTHPNFTHVRKRGIEVPRRMYRGAQWLFADTNVPPDAALATLESVVTNQQVSIRGLLVNLKLLDWKLAAEVPRYLAQVQSWGFSHVAARQLGHNRQEFCLSAWRDRPRRQRPSGERRSA